MSRRSLLSHVRPAGLALGFVTLVAALAGAALATATPAGAALSSGCNALNDPVLDGLYKVGFRQFLSFQAGERLTLQAGPPGFVGGLVHLQVTDPAGNRIQLYAGNPGTIVYDFPLTGVYPLILWVSEAPAVTWQVGCASTAPASAPPPRELPGKPAANAGTPADVAIVSQALSPAPTVGAAATLTITATNKGPMPGSDAFIKDVLPDGLRFVACTSTVDGAPAGSCSWDGKNTVVANLGTFKSGSSATFTIGVAATKAGAGFKNTVGIGADEWDPDWSNNFASIPVTIS
jgi:uncharacterized repeat protein (TIGR01451 family)